jgi:hypothetical protein
VEDKFAFRVRSFLLTRTTGFISQVWPHIFSQNACVIGSLGTKAFVQVEMTSRDRWIIKFLATDSGPKLLVSIDIEMARHVSQR